MTTRLAWIVIGMAATAGGASAAKADFLTQTSTVSLATTDFNQTLTYDKFDPSLGTLLSVRLAFAGTIASTFVFFAGPTPTVVTADVAGTIAIGPTAGSTTSILATIDNDATRSLPANGSDSFAQTAIGSAGFSSTDPTDLALFTGPGTLTVPLAVTATSLVSTDTGNGGGLVRTKAGGDFTIRYEYRAVPEPSSVALMGLGALAATAWLGRRRPWSRRASRGDRAPASLTNRFAGRIEAGDRD